MTIGELSILLGFKIEGIDDVKEVSKEIDKAVGTTTKLALGVDLLAAGLGAMIHGALAATTSLRQFGLATGLSTTELQQWQYRASLANVSAQEMMETIENIQKTGMKVATTGEGAQPWVLLGIDPTQDPFKVLTQLSAALQSVDNKRVALARTVTDSLVSRNVFAMLRNAGPGSLPGRFIINSDDQAKMSALNREWQQLGILVDADKNKFVSQLAPALTDVVILLERAANAASRVVQWLTIHPNVARGIADVAVATTTLAAGLTVIGGINFALTAAGMTAAFSPVLAAAVAIGAIVGGIELLTHLKQNQNDNYNPANPIGKPNTRDSYQKRFGYGLGADSESSFDPAHPLGRRYSFRDVVPGISAAGRSSTVTQTNHITVNEAVQGKSGLGKVIDSLGVQLDAAGLGAEAVGY